MTRILDETPAMTGLLLSHTTQGKIGKTST